VLHPSKLDETVAEGKGYNPFTLWRLTSLRNAIPPPPHTLASRGRMIIHKTLQMARNLMHKIGFERVWVP
jgi:hypothetical protein